MSVTLAACSGKKGRSFAAFGLCLGVIAALSCSSQSEDSSSTGGGGPGSGAASGSGGKAAGGSAGGAGTSGGSGTSGGAGTAGGAGTGGGAGGSSGGAGTGGSAGVGPDGGGAKVGAADFGSTDLDPPSHGGTLTFEQIGAPGWYPSRRDPASGQCDAIQNASCCMTRHELTTNQLTPWNEELIMTLRGPMRVKQFVVYQPDASNAATWNVVSVWDERAAARPEGIAFDGDGSFEGVVGSECLVDVMTATVFPCGSGSVPYCPAPGANQKKYYGWQGSKLFVLLADMPHPGSGRIADSVHCGQGTSGGWYDAPWIGLSHGELVRSGKFGNCHCYAKDPAQWYLADGCGQFNAFEVVNDNNQYKNLELFSTNLFAYHGYVGEGPCGTACNISGLSATVDLINKSTRQEAAAGAVASPSKGPGAAFRRPAIGYRYFILLLDVDTRKIQLGIVHPKSIPPAIAGVLPDLPRQIQRSAVDALLALRLPK